jgi:hypothetical protein
MQTIMQRAKCRRRAASLLVPNNSRIWRQQHDLAAVSSLGISGHRSAAEGCPLYPKADMQDRIANLNQDLVPKAAPYCN